MRLKLATTEGIELVSLPVGTHICIGEKIVLELAKIGKECHTGCAIYRQIGKCIMPKEGVFAKVIRGGSVRAGYQVRRMTEDGERGREISYIAAYQGGQKQHRG